MEVAPEGMDSGTSLIARPVVRTGLAMSVEELCYQAGQSRWTGAAIRVLGWWKAMTNAPRMRRSLAKCCCCCCWSGMERWWAGWMFDVVAWWY